MSFSSPGASADSSAGFGLASLEAEQGGSSDGDPRPAFESIFGSRLPYGRVRRSSVKLARDSHSTGTERSLTEEGPACSSVRAWSSSLEEEGRSEGASSVGSTGVATATAARSDAAGSPGSAALPGVGLDAGFSHRAVRSGSRCVAVGDHGLCAAVLEE